MKKVLMTLSEALQIRRGIYNKTLLQKKLGAHFLRLNYAHINNLAGLTEDYCHAATIMSGVQVNEMTKEGLEKAYKNFKAEWKAENIRKKMPLKHENEYWGKMMACEKVLQDWRETCEMDFGELISQCRNDKLDTSFMDD